MAEDVWILGIKMTKFGKHPDKDTVDLAAEAALGALADAGVTIQDMGVLAAGNLMGGRRAGIGQHAAEADRPDRHPRLQRVQRVRHGRHRAAHRDHGDQGGRVRHGPGGRRREAGRRRPARRWRRASPTTTTWTAARRYGAVAAARRPSRHRDDARRLRPDRHGVRPQVRRHALRAVRPDQREEPRPLHAQPARRLHQEDDARADHERRHDRLPEHPADVLGELRRRGRRGGRLATRKLKTLVARAAAARGEGVGLGAHHRPVAGGVPGAPRRQHAHAATRRRRPTSRPASVPRTSTSSSCTTASRPPSSSTTTTSGCASRAARSTSSSRARRGATGTTPVNVSGGLESKGHPIAATGIANIWEVCHHLRGEAGDRQIDDAKVGLAHVIGLGTACGVHILERSAA